MSNPEDNFNEQIATLTNHVVDVMEKTAGITKKGPAPMLLTLGAILILLVAFLKLEVQGVRFSNLTSSEFMTLTLSATLLLVLASLIRLYQFKSWREIIKEQQRLGADLIRQQQRGKATIKEKG